MSKIQTFEDTGATIVNLTIEEGDDVLPCPFCGGTDIELCNTHTASYWLTCACGAEMHGPYGGDSRRGSKYRSRGAEVKAHRKAKAGTLALWNTRPRAR